MHHLLKAVTIALLAVGLNAAVVSRSPAAASEATPEATAERTNCDQGSYIEDVGFSNNGKLIAAGWNTGKYKVWDIKSGQLLHEFQVGDAELIANVSFSNDDQYMVSIDYETATVWEMQSFKQIQSIPFPKDQYGARHAYITPDNRFLITVMDTGASLWDIISGEKVHDYPGNAFHTQALARVSPDGNYLLVRNITKDDTPTWDLWDTYKGQKLHTFVTFVNTATFSPDSRILVIDKENHGLQLWNVKTQTEMHTLNTQDYYPPDWWAFSPDSQLLLSDYHDTDVALWSVETGAILHVFSKDFPSALVGFGPDNKTLYAMDDPANSDAKAQFHIWRLKDYQMMQEIPLRYKADFKKLRISRDVEYLALVSNHAVEVTSLKNGEILRRFC